MEDHFDIRSLPSNFVSESHPSHVIEKLNEKRKKAHSAVLEEICLRKKEINIEIEKEILDRSNKAKSKLKRIRDDTDYFIYLIQHMRDHEFDAVEPNYFQNISKKVLDYNETRKANVDEFYDALVGIEKKRGDELKSMLRETYEKLTNISYKLPFEVEEFFEKEILRINQLTLNNYNNYVELQAELKLQIENDMKMWMQKLYEIKEKFQKHLKDVATQQSDEFKTSSTASYIDTTFSRMNRRLSEYDAMKMVLEFKLSQIYVKVDLKNISIWLQDVQLTMACLDRSAKYIVNIYKAAIVVIFHRFFRELEDIKTSMLDIDMLSREEIEPYECEIYTPTAEELNLKDEKEFQRIKEVWGKLITSIEDSLNETYAFVKKSTYLWDNHFVRIEEAQELVLEDVSNTIEKNIITEEGFEGKLNILLDKLRQCPTEQKLEKCLGDVRKGLDKVEELYYIHNGEEQKVTEKYRELVDIAIDVLMAEIKRFLVLHPPDEEKDPKKQRKRASQESHVFVDPTEELIPHQMLFCRYEVDALSNWMFGLWEAINHYLSCGRAEIAADAEEWIKSQCGKIKDRLKVKLTLFKTRYERIQYSIYEKRLEELTCHSNRLQTHQMAVELELKNLVKSQYLNEDKYNDVLNTFANKKDTIIQHILNVNKSSHIRRFKEGLKVATEDAMNTIDCILEDAAKACDDLDAKIKISTMKFKKAIRLFSEEGNYDVEEAKIVLKTLNKVDASAEKSLELIRKDNKSVHNNYKYKLEVRNLEASTSIQEIIEELEHNEKNIDKIVHLQNEIRNLVISVKTLTMRLKKMLKNLTEASTKKLGDTEYLPIFLDKFEEIVEKISKDAPFLIHPEPVILFSLVNTEWPNSSSTNNHFEDFTKYIFDTKPPEDDECFVSKLNNSLYQSFSNIQVGAKEFYSKHTIVLDFPKIQPTYSEFMTEVLRKYKNFLIQGDICWIETTSDFTDFLDHFLNFKKEYRAAFENTFYNVSHDYYAKVQNEIMKKLREDREDLERSYKKMHSKLKPLYGHPNNQHLLEQIENEFQELAQNAGEKLNAILPPYKDILLSEFEKIKNTYDETKDKLNCLTEYEGLADIQTTLKTQLFTKADLMREIIEMDDRSEISDDEKKENVPLSISREIITYMRNVHSQTQTKSNTSISTTLSSSTVEELSQRDFLNELWKTFKEYEQIVTDFVDKKLLDYHREFKLTWGNDVQNILNLYKVKYDLKNVPSK